MSRAKFLAEAMSPYRGLRLFIYLAAGLSGSIGGVIFLLQTLAGRDLAVALPTLALQSGVVALSVGLWRWEKARQRRQEERIAAKLAQKSHS
ncbi:MAG: hypothetical protein OHK0012_01900 [Synechococcales cyanobacterium]